jgi:hypothetical protein
MNEFFSIPNNCDISFINVGNNKEKDKLMNIKIKIRLYIYTYMYV